MPDALQIRDLLRSPEWQDLAAVALRQRLESLATRLLKHRYQSLEEQRIDQKEYEILHRLLHDTERMLTPQ